MTDRRVAERLAARHLSAELAQRWLSMLRPAVRLVPAAGSDRIVARLGGAPVMPESVSWPTWPGHGPLSYLGEIRCAELTRFDLDIAVPADGRFLFFYFDGGYHVEPVIAATEPSAAPGAYALYIPESQQCSIRRAPHGVPVYDQLSLRGLSILSPPPLEHPGLSDLFAAGPGPAAFFAHVPDPNAFNAAMWEMRTGVCHQVGGYPDVVQDSVEEQVAYAVLNAHECANVPDPVPFDTALCEPSASVLDTDQQYDHERVVAEALQWRLFVQLDTDVRIGMMWGDSGVVYWLARQTDLDQHRFDRLAFTSQSA